MVRRPRSRAQGNQRLALTRARGPARRAVVSKAKDRRDWRRPPGLIADEMRRRRGVSHRAISATIPSSITTSGRSNERLAPGRWEERAGRAAGGRDANDAATLGRPRESVRLRSFETRAKPSPRPARPPATIEEVGTSCGRFVDSFFRRAILGTGRKK